MNKIGIEKQRSNNNTQKTIKQACEGNHDHKFTRNAHVRASAIVNSFYEGFRCIAIYCKEYFC